MVREREKNRRLAAENHKLLCEISNLKTTIDYLRRASALNEATITKKESQLKVRNRALQEKDTILSGMTEQLTRARECLATQQQVSIHAVLGLHYGVGHTMCCYS